MNICTQRWWFRVITVACFAMSASLAASAQAVSNPITLADQVMAAKTKADHEALASAFDKQAEADKSMAERHQSLAKAYTSAPWAKGSGAAMVKHCKSLTKAYRESASSNTDMAKMHRSVAAKLP